MWVVDLDPTCPYARSMMTSSNGSIFRVAGPLCGEFTGHRRTPLKKASDAELLCFLWSLWKSGWVNNRDAAWWFETPSCSLWRQCNVNVEQIMTSCHGIVFHITDPLCDGKLPFGCLFCREWVEQTVELRRTTRKWTHGQQRNRHSCRPHGHFRAKFVWLLALVIYKYV